MCLKIKELLIYFSITFLFLFLMSCNTVHPTHKTSAQQIQNSMQDSIDIDKSLSTSQRKNAPSNHLNTALLPPLSPRAGKLG